MQETYKRIKEQEQAKNGLVILKAIYGNSEEIADLDNEYVDGFDENFICSLQNIVSC